MDFSPTPEQQDAAQLAATILADACTPDALRALDQRPDHDGRFDAALWRTLADAGLLSLSLPEEHGGSGLGVLELASVLVEAGRVLAPAPLGSHAVAAMALARFGDTALQDRWLPAAADGTAILTAAVAEELDAAPQTPATTARTQGDQWRLDGTKVVVPAGTRADLVLVPASTDSGVAVFAVAPGDPGVSIEAQRLSDGDVVGRIRLDGVVLGADRLLGSTDGSSYGWLREHLIVALCAQQLGTLEGALALTASYAKEREQFGRPIGTFQAVSQRLADAYIDVLGVRLTLWQAAWRLSEGLDAAEAVATAKIWAADAGHRVAHTTVHVHGGVGIDLDGEAHRYFTTAKRQEHTLGHSTEQNLALGKILTAVNVLA